MAKRVIIYCVIGFIAILGAYIYFGMYWAQQSNQPDETDIVSEELTPLERLQNAGAMSEDERQNMIERLEKQMAD